MQFVFVFILHLIISIVKHFFNFIQFIFKKENGGNNSAVLQLK